MDGLDPEVPHTDVPATKQGVLSPLAKILDNNDHLKKSVKDGKQHWFCRWCKQDFAGWNATKYMYHAAKVSNKGIKVCADVIPIIRYRKYVSLVATNLGDKNRKQSNCV